MANNELNLAFAQLSMLRIRVLANRLGCDSEMARNVHDKLAAVLAEMIEDQRKIDNARSVVAFARGTAEKNEAAADLHYFRTGFFEKWQIEAVALLDDHWVDRLTHEYYDFNTGRWYFCDGFLPIAVPVEADKLCGLAEIIAEIEQVSGIHLTIEHVYYSEAEAEDAFCNALGEDPAVIAEAEAAAGLS